MEDLIKTIDTALGELQKNGATRGQCIMRITNLQEISAESGELSLLRSVENKTSVNLSSYVGDKMGTAQTGSLNAEELKNCAAACVSSALSSPGDDAYGMNESGEELIIKSQRQSVGIEKLIEHTGEFLDSAAKKYPSVNLRRVTVKQISGVEIYKNTFGTTIVNPVNHYQFNTMFLAQDGKKISSYSNSGFHFNDISKPFMEMGMLNEMLENSTKQINPSVFSSKKLGTVIIAPQCLDHFMSFMINAFMSGPSIVWGTSRWRNSLNQEVSNGLNLCAMSLDSRLVTAPGFTSEGFPAGNQDIIKDGKLVSLLADLYTSNKTGLPRAQNYGWGLVAQNGTKTLEEMIEKVEDGLLMYRFSGGTPQASGDFSGIAKNSFIIKDGVITGAAKETTVSGNLADMLMNIQGISSEIVCDGNSVMPYMAFGGITIQ